MDYTFSMPLAKLSSQRQITIPKWILELVGAKIYDQLSMQYEDGKIVLKLVKKNLIEELAGSWKTKISLDKRDIPLESAIKQAKILAAKQIAAEGRE